MHGPVVSVVIGSNGMFLLLICCYVHGYATTIQCYATVIFILQCHITICAILLLCAMIFCNNALLCCSDLYFIILHRHMHCCSVAVFQWNAVSHIFQVAMVCWHVATFCCCVAMFCCRVTVYSMSLVLNM